MHICAWWDRVRSTCLVYVHRKVNQKNQGITVACPTSSRLSDNQNEQFNKPLSIFTTSCSWIVHTRGASLPATKSEELHSYSFTFKSDNRIFHPLQVLQPLLLHSIPSVTTVVQTRHGGFDWAVAGNGERGMD